MNNTEIATVESAGFLTETVNLNDLFSEEMEGLRPSFDKISIPAGGGLSFEVPGDDPSSPDSVKQFKAVMRELYANGHSQKEIADAFSISRRHVNDIVNGRTWKLEG